MGCKPMPVPTSVWEHTAKGSRLQQAAVYFGRYPHPGQTIRIWQKWAGSPPSAPPITAVAVPGVLYGYRQKGKIHNLCMPNAILTFKEYLLVHASPGNRQGRGAVDRKRAASSAQSRGTPGGTRNAGPHRGRGKGFVSMITAAVWAEGSCWMSTHTLRIFPR